MNQAEKFVDTLYSTFEGRAPVRLGTRTDMSAVYPFVFEDENGIPLGLVSCTADNKENEKEVHLYHISSFKINRGHGTKIMNYLCNLADNFGVSIYLQAEVQFSGRDTPMNEDLEKWYKKFGFQGNCIMRRHINN